MQNRHLIPGLLEIAAQCRTSKLTVIRWRKRFVQQRLEGIVQDAPRPARLPSIEKDVIEKIIRKTTQEKPHLAAQWSTRTIAEAVGASKATVQSVWAARGLKPLLSKTFKVTNDPQFAEKMVDLEGLYLDPPEHALVLSCDKKSQLQALDRTQKGLPIVSGRCGAITADYKRHGTTTLFASLNVAE